MPSETRTSAKIRYAKVMLAELEGYAHRGSGDDFERSHQEAFLAHLFGARDAFLQELNEYYSCSIPIEEVSVASLERWEKLNG
jgi:hypothetical protein